MTDHRQIVRRAPRGLDVPGLVTRDLTFSEAGPSIDPFLVVSQFTMTGPVFPPHPHAGFSVATYIVPESEIGMLNQDSLGTRRVVAPGEMQWTVAGRGIQHEETPERSGRAAIGFQIWIDHRTEDRQAEPQALHLHAQEVPVREGGGITRRILVGRSGNLASPLSVPTPVSIVDMAFVPGARLSGSAGIDETAFLWVRAGRLDAAGAAAEAGDVVFAGSAGLDVVARESTLATLFAGPALRSPIVPGGPFVASSAEELAGFRRAFGEGRMGRLAPFDQAALDRDWDKAHA